MGSLKHIRRTSVGSDLPPTDQPERQAGGVDGVPYLVGERSKGLGTVLTHLGGGSRRERLDPSRHGLVEKDVHQLVISRGERVVLAGGELVQLVAEDGVVVNDPRYLGALSLPDETPLCRLGGLHGLAHGGLVERLAPSRTGVPAQHADEAVDEVSEIVEQLLVGLSRARLSKRDQTVAQDVSLAGFDELVHLHLSVHGVRSSLSG